MMANILAFAVGVLALANMAAARSLRDEPFVSRRDMTIIGGHEIKPYSRPYLVQLSASGDQEQQSTFCGGSIVDKSFILTAAHCVDGREPQMCLFRITAAEHNISEHEGREQRRELAEIIVHPEYDRMSSLNDIALLRLKRPLKLNNKVKVVDLNTNPKCPKNGGRCIVMGWGTVDTSGWDPLPDSPQETTVHAISNKKCNESYTYENIWDSNLCAGEEEGGKDSCQGDSGGPMMCKCHGDFVQAGIVSWGYGCALAQYPGVYTRVSSFTDWITSTIASRGG